MFACIAIRPMVYAASLKASTLDYVNPRAILTSGMQTISSASCVQFSLLHASGAAFGIRVPECVLTAPDDNGLLLNVTDRGLGDSWHMFWLPLDVPAGYNNTCQALLQFELVYDLSFGTRINTAVSKVLLHNSTCLGELFNLVLLCSVASLSYIFEAVQQVMVSLYNFQILFLLPDLLRVTLLISISVDIEMLQEAVYGGRENLSQMQVSMF